MTTNTTRTARVPGFAIWLLLICPAAHAQFDSGSDGSDGAFEPTESVQIDLSLAATASWATPSPVPGQGVYDPDKWAVVFKYTTITIPSGVAVTFKNHPSGAPVVWLASGDVGIWGTVNLDGKAGGGETFSTFSQAGPGGFGGGQRGLNTSSHAPSGGFGPGGAPPQLSTASYSAGGGYALDGLGGDGLAGGKPYGNTRVLPLIGGSGGSGTFTTGADAGAGGGAILIASSGDIRIHGGQGVRAIGGAGNNHAGGGSGGAIRLIANRIGGEGELYAYGGINTIGNNSYGRGSVGRISVEAYEINLTNAGSPNWNWATEPGPVFPPNYAPTLKATRIVTNANVDPEPVVPLDPEAGVVTTDVYIADLGQVTVEIEATNIPLGTTVEVRVVPERGPVIIYTSTPLEDPDGDDVLTATATITFLLNRSEMQLRANWDPTP